MEKDLLKRLFSFSTNVIFAVRKLPRTVEYKVITYQLIRSATSSGANYEESQSAVSYADFRNKVGIALKEMRESNYWLRLINSTLPEQNDFTVLDKE